MSEFVFLFDNFTSDKLKLPARLGGPRGLSDRQLNSRDAKASFEIARDGLYRFNSARTGGEVRFARAASSRHHSIKEGKRAVVEGGTAAIAK